MKASELLRSRVIDSTGADLGPVRDVRVRETADGFSLAGIVVGRGRFAQLAHALGVAEGRVQGPWLLRRICASAVEDARFAPASAVEDWGPGVVRLRIAAGDLEGLQVRSR